jgi:hypothetical protein
MKTTNFQNGERTKMSQLRTYNKTINQDSKTHTKIKWEDRARSSS